MRYVLNPGDFQEVRTFSNHESAVWDHVHTKGSRLYRVNGKTWSELTDLGWNLANRDNLPVKVLSEEES